jgi:hypothetical protein
LKTTVFTSSDYADLTNDCQYLQLLKHVLFHCTVVFVGYSLSHCCPAIR